MMSKWLVLACGWSVAALGGFLLSSTVYAVDPYGPKNAALTLVVMDPMATPLACDCVEGYAQRKYERLADYLHEKTGKTVRVVWSESLTKALAEEANGQAHIVIGKDSVVRADATVGKRNLLPVAHLTDTNGSPLQRGLFVVLKDDPAATLLDIEGYTILWGPTDCEEKSRSVAVISSYAAPLLEGCGTIKKGDLRVIGQSDEVPFVAAFVDESLPSEVRQSITQALLNMKSEPMLAALETKSGFLPYTIEASSKETSIEAPGSVNPNDNAATQKKTR
jgi:ABC-type phosphate/phosphonate transport system substrate-binding protein